MATESNPTLMMRLIPPERHADRNILRRLRKHLRTASLLLGLTLICAPCAWAQSSLSLEDAFRLAAEHSTAIQLADSRVATESVGLMEARAEWLPSLSVSSSTSRNWGLQFDETTGSLVTRSRDFASFGASTSWTVFDGFSRGHRIQAAELGVQAQSAGAARARQEVMAEVLRRYLQVLVDTEQLRIRDGSLDIQRVQLDMISADVRMGSRPTSEQLTQENAVVQAESALQSAESALELSRAQLLHFLRLDPVGAYEFVVPERSADAETESPENLGGLVDQALALRPDLASAERLVEAAEMRLQVSRSARLPALSLRADSRTSYSSIARDRVTGEPESFLDQLPENRAYSAGVSLSIPILDRRQTRAAVDRGQIQIEEAQVQANALQRQVELEVTEAWLQLRGAVRRAETTERLLESAAGAVEVEETRYAVGAGSLLELLIARSSLVTASLERVQAVYELEFRKRLLGFYVGRMP